MKTYGQACGLAKALDAVGDRWTLLIVRELLTRGACRYTDLKRGLPGIATNLLAERLVTLEEGGVVVRTAALPPVATDLFSLTDRGRALEPALMLLGLWGAPMLADTEDDDFQAHWMVLPLRTLLQPVGAASVEIRSDGETVTIIVQDGEVDVYLGPNPSAQTFIEGPGREIFGYLSGKRDAAAAEQAGVTIRGDSRALDALRPSANRRARTGQASTAAH
jgi:DNA-binding HxlR family transcriptional regulator